MSMFRDIICPFCGTHNEITEGALDVDEHGNFDMADPDMEPQRGDPTLCGTCGEWCIFDLVPGGARKPNGAEYFVLGLNPATKLMREAWVRYNAEREAGD